MSWTKRELLDQAFGELALPGYIFDLEAEDITSAIRRLDSMIASWGSKGINLSYPLSSGADTTDPDQDSQLPEHAVFAVTSNLAIRIAPTYGKMVSAETRTSARQAYLALLTQCSTIPSMQFDRTLPKGAGNKPIRGTNKEFFRETESLDAGNDSTLDFNG
jgi:hypothetical protein